MIRLSYLLIMTLAICAAPAAMAARLESGQVHVWETQEVTLQAAGDYKNPYVDVDVWVELEGPGFKKRVYGFWDGDRTFKVRFVATTPGDWKWKSASNHTDDAGLNGGGGTFKAVAWDESEIAENPNRRGFVRAS